MTTYTRFDMKVTGLQEMNAGLRTLQGPALPKVIDDSAGRTLRAVAVPTMRRQLRSDFKDPGSHREPRKRGGSGERATPKPGRQGPAERNVRVRKLRKRGNEIVAYSAGARAWYAHLPIGGTKAHPLTGRPGASRYSVLPFRANAVAGRQGRRAMGLRLSMAGQAVAGGWGVWEQRTVALRGIRMVGASGAGQSVTRGSVRFNRGLRHPGTTGTNSIQKASRQIEPQLNARYSTDLQAAFEKHLTGPMRRARSRTT